MTTTYKPALPLIVEASGHALPDGYDRWAMKSVRADLRTRYGYRWPFPGKVAKAANPTRHDDPCPSVDGDGLCVADTYAGMAMGGYVARTLLLVAVKDKHVLADRDGKQRVAECLVIDVLDGEALAREHLYGADLRGADLYGADLRRADLRRANLRGADLRGADLRGAYLRGADLYGADLRGADLRRANLRGADLRRADLRRANLRGADLYGADLCGAVASAYTRWPDGFDAAKAGVRVA